SGAFPYSLCDRMFHRRTRCDRPPRSLQVQKRLTAEASSTSRRSRPRRAKGGVGETIAEGTSARNRRACFIREFLGTGGGGVGQRWKGSGASYGLRHRLRTLCESRHHRSSNGGWRHFWRIRSAVSGTHIPKRPAAADEFSLVSDASYERVPRD